MKEKALLEIEEWPHTEQTGQWITLASPFTLFSFLITTSYTNKHVWNTPQKQHKTVYIRIKHCTKINSQLELWMTSY